MKRLALLAASVFVALTLSACGDHAEKKAEDNAATVMEQQQQDQNTSNPMPATDSTAPATETDTVKPADQSSQ